MNLGGGLNRPRASETDPPSFLEWTTAPLAHDVDVIGPIELQWDVACSAPDTAFIAFLQDVYDHGNATNITAAYLRAGLRKVDEEQSRQAAPVLPCKTFEAIPIGQKVPYRIPLVPNARRFKAGHRLRLYLTTDDQNKDVPAPLGFRHASVGTSSLIWCFHIHVYRFPWSSRLVCGSAPKNAHCDGDRQKQPGKTSQSRCRPLNTNRS
jgi:hypothetical protein